MRYEWCYPALAVNVTTGRLWWQWTTSMRQEAIAPVVVAWQDAGLGALVWHGAPAHRARLVREVGVALITQPAAVPRMESGRAPLPRSAPLGRRPGLRHPR